MRLATISALLKVRAMSRSLSLLLCTLPTPVPAADGHVLIRHRPATTAQAVPGEGSGSGQARAEAVVALDINRAGAGELEAALDGVGPAKAAAIIAWREQNGPFRTQQDLLAVKGLGPAFLEKNRLRLALPVAPVTSSPTSTPGRLSESPTLLQKSSGIRLD